MNKLLKEYLDFIKETPIEDISHIGNPNTATNFTKPEIKMLQTEKYQKRLKDAFKNTPFVFDIVFDYHKDFDASFDDDNYSTGSFIPDNKIIDAYHQDRYSDSIKGKPGVITFVSQGNLSPENRIPMTPWILAHKIAHAIDQNEIYFNFIDKNSLNYKIFNFIDDNSIDEEIYKNLFSFKSWKTIGFVKLITSGELYTELVTLYLITGKIQPNKTGNESFDNMIEQYCLKFTTLLENLFKSLEGKILTEV
jgi:hypothetical protein